MMASTTKGNEMEKNQGDYIIAAVGIVGCIVIVILKLFGVYE